MCFVSVPTGLSSTLCTTALSVSVFHELLLFCNTLQCKDDTSDTNNWETWRRKITSHNPCVGAIWPQHGTKEVKKKRKKFLKMTFVKWVSGSAVTEFTHKQPGDPEIHGSTAALGQLLPNVCVCTRQHMQVGRLLKHWALSHPHTIPNQCYTVSTWKRWK